MSLKPRSPVLAVDLDETVIDSDTEELIPGAKDAIIRLKRLGWRIIIWTARSNAVEYTRDLLDRLGVPYDEINQNLETRDGESRKIHFDAVIDNKNVDFQDGWEAAVRELETRRDGWQNQGVTKVAVRSMSRRDGKVVEEQLWSLDTSGNAVCVRNSGVLEKFSTVDGVGPEQGSIFLEAIMKSVQSTYLWAEEE